MKSKFIIVFAISLLGLKTKATVYNVGSLQTYKTIQSAINASSNNDTVLVQEGIYNENINFYGKSITVASLYLLDGNAMHANMTQIQGTGTSSVVTFASNEDSTAALIGFAILNGFSGYGGGIYCLNASPRLDQLIIAYNYASYYGGGMYMENSFSKVTNLISYLNKAGNSGGGILTKGGAPILEDVVVSNDTAVVMGAGIFIGWNSNPVLKNFQCYNNVISDTSTPTINGSGGGMMIWTKSNPTLINVDVHNNRAKSGGGIACWYGSKPNFVSVKIRNNNLYGNSLLSSNGGGGGLEIWSSDVVVKNTLIEGNKAQRGGGVFISESNTKFINTTIEDNEAALHDKGGGIYKGWGGVMDIKNSSIYHNYAPLIPHNRDLINNISDCGSGCVTSISPEEINISHSLIEISSIITENPLSYDSTNISSDPIFDSQYNLTAESPCRDAGSNLVVFDLPSFDLAGNYRVDNCLIDIGAFEYVTGNNLQPYKSVQNVTPSCSQFKWIDGNTYFSDTIISHKLFAKNGCDSIVTLNLLFGSGSDIETNTNGVTITINNSGGSYKWLNCDESYGVISNQTSKSFTATSNGNYAVELSENGCLDTSDCVSINTLGLHENSFDDNLIVYPNPTLGEVLIKFKATQPFILLKIMDSSGKLLDQIKHENIQLIKYDLNQEKGVYLFEVSDGKNQSSFIRVIK